MKKVLLYVVLLGMGLMGGSALGDEETKPLFMRDRKAVRKFYFYRSYVDKKSKLTNLNPAGVILSKQSYGSGIYSVTFAVNESHKKFRYHQPYFVFYFNPAIKDSKELKQKMKKGANYLYLVWRKSGQVEFYKYTADGKKEKLGLWIKPGPKKDNAYKKDTFVTMNIVVPEAGNDLKIYFNKPAEGEPDCEFTMPDSPANGMFGFYNAKWYSYIMVKDIQYRELQK